MAKRLASSPATLIGRAVRLRDRSRLMRTARAFYKLGRKSYYKSKGSKGPCLLV